MRASDDIAIAPRAGGPFAQERGEWRRLRAVVWVLVYLGLVVLPLVVLTRSPTVKGGGYWWDFAMALGFGGVAMLALQSGLTARFRRATAPFGVDIIYYFHRFAAVAGFALVLGHYAVLRWRHAEALDPLNPAVAPWHMTAGRIALGLFAVLIVSSLWRKQLRLEYDRWRILHAAMAVVAMLLAIGHIWGVGNYTRSLARGLPWMIFTLGWIVLVIYIRIGRPWTLLREPYRVTDVRAERGRSWTVSLAPDGHVGLTFKPGQFAWLTLGTSPFRAKEHPFSFSSSAATPAVLQFTIKELGDFTRTIKAVHPGTLAYVDGPHGVFTTDHHASAAGFVFIAGGVGIAPIMSMLRTLADRNETRPLRLVYGNRRWEDVIFREEIESIQGRLNLAVVHVLQEPHLGWTGLTGILSEDVLHCAIPSKLEDVVFFLCGPKPMSDSVQHTLRNRGVPLRRIHCELFDMA